MPGKITDWLECDKMNEGFEALYDKKIVSSVTTLQEEKLMTMKGQF